MIKPLHVLDTGEGPAAVLLHGQPGSSGDWSLVVDRMPSDVRVLVPDRPGYGRTGGRAVGIERNGTLLLEMLDGLGIERATFVAHSWAGAVALWLAEAHPERVDALVLAASVGPQAVTLADRVLAMRLVGETVAWSGSKAMRRVLITERGRAAISARLGEGATEILRSGLSGRAWHAFTVEQRSMVRELPHIVSGMGGIEAPTAVVTGDRDRVVDPAIASALVQRISTARLITVPGAGHALPVEAPDALASTITTAMRSRGRMA